MESNETISKEPYTCMTHKVKKLIKKIERMNELSPPYA